MPFSSRNRFLELSDHSDSSEYIDNDIDDPDFNPNPTDSRPRLLPRVEPVKRTNFSNSGTSHDHSYGLVSDALNNPGLILNQPGPSSRPDINEPSLNQSPPALVVYSSSSISDDDEESSDMEIGPVNINRTKKRAKNPDQHKQKKAKIDRNSGQRYVTKKGIVVEGKSFEDVPCSCKLKCNEQISQENRKSMFDSFWKMGNFVRQNTYLCGLVQKQTIKQRRPRKEEGIKRSSSNKYFLKPHNDMSVVVCKKYFLSTFKVSEGRLSRALKKTNDSRSPGDDLRGKKGCPSRKISDEDSEYVKRHIQSFPLYESHYTRKHNPHQKYLQESLNLRQMYRLYVEKCLTNEREPVKEHFYRYIFNSKFNIHFFTPRKDTCKTCDIYKIKVSNPDISDMEKSGLERGHELHLRKAELARDSMKNDAAFAKNNEEYYACSIDLQKALPFPVLTVSDAYYKRNLYCYNFGVHDLTKDLGFFYTWNETVAGRGSQEMSSCVVKHLEFQANGKKKVTIYSDSCGGQNRNIKMVLALMRFIQNDDVNIEVIDQKFLISGHSFLPNDSDFGSVELAAKGKTIYVPQDWKNIMTSCRNKKKFIVCEMKSEDFISTENLERNISRRKKNTEKHAVNWLKIQWIRLEKGNPYEIKYKETLNDAVQFDILDIKPTGRKGRPTSLKNVPLIRLYPGIRPVGPLKKRDMLDLLQFIPPVYHNFFQNLKSDATDEEDIGPLPYNEVPEEDEGVEEHDIS